MKTRGLALFFGALLSGCYEEHADGDAAVHADGASCTADGAYDVPIRIDTPSPAGCLEPGMGMLALHIPPTAEDFGGRCDGMASITPMGDCTWHVDVACHNPDASSHIVGTIDARGGIHGRLESEFTGFSGVTCHSTIEVGE